MKTEQVFVILTPGWAASESDSTCLPMQQELIQTINRIFPQLKVVILSFQYPYEGKSYQWFGNKVISFNGRNRGGLQRLLLRRKINRVLHTIAEQNEIIGLLSFWYSECAAVGEIFARKNGYKHKCWLLGQDARAGNKYPKRLSLKEDALIALSDFVQEEFERNYRIKPLFVLPPGVTPYRNDLMKKDIDLLAVGSLIPLKQYSIFLEVVAAIKKQKPSVKAVLIGEGPEMKLLHGLVDKLNLKENVLLLGELSHPKVLTYMNRTKLFLHPSSYEGFGVVCLEALMNGAKLVSFVKPMKIPISNWYVVPTQAEMIEIVVAMLSDENLVYETTIPFPMEDLVVKLMNLYQVESTDMRPEELQKSFC